jgi:hypothetical protein
VAEASTLPPNLPSHSGARLSVTRPRKALRLARPFSTSAARVRRSPPALLCATEGLPAIPLCRYAAHPVLLPLARSDSQAADSSRQLAPALVRGCAGARVRGCAVNAGTRPRECQRYVTRPSGFCFHPEGSPPPVAPF